MKLEIECDLEDFDIDWDGKDVDNLVNVFSDKMRLLGWQPCIYRIVHEPVVERCIRSWSNEVST